MCYRSEIVSLSWYLVRYDQVMHSATISVSPMLASIKPYGDSIGKQIHVALTTQLVAFCVLTAGPSNTLSQVSPPQQTPPLITRADNRTDAQPQAQETPKHAKPTFPRATPAEVKQIIPDVVTALLALQENQEGVRGGKDANQWPYEGVYRTNGQIPIGYRIGGTAIVILALCAADGYAEDDARKEAVGRALAYICSAREHPDMSTRDYAGGYDVRIWGSIEALHTLSRLTRDSLIPDDLKLTVNAAIEYYLESVITLEMPQTGGWNYARPDGANTAGVPSSFVTGCALQAIFEAKAAGFNVNESVVARGLTVLNKARGSTGTVVYSGAAPEKLKRSDGVQGATGRMVLTEATLVLAGAGTHERLRSSLDAFIAHWDWLDQRRAKNGTHVAPYMVAPYYFMFAHRYAAQAIELLPTNERAEYRSRINGLLMSVRADDNTWNDRVFPRSAGYGTAMAILSINAPQEKCATWEAVKTESQK